MARKGCTRCGAAKVARPASSFTAQIDQATVNNTMARVQFKYSVKMEINGLHRNFYVGQVIDLNYSLIAVLLTTYPKCLYFDDTSDQYKFLAVYQELR
jgi:hypothetical protein